jgi:nucleoside-diphosphate-sugar epimerase
VVELLGERTQLETFSRQFAKFAPDAVIDTFAMTEADALMTVNVCSGLARRLVVFSSMDVYRAYDRLRGTDSSVIDNSPLSEDSPLRETLFPYRGQSTSGDELLFNYEKILVERVVLRQPSMPSTVVRLPCVYGPGDYQHRTSEYLKQMDEGNTSIVLGEVRAKWRWTRGYAPDVAAAIVLAATDERAGGRIYNVGEAESLTEADWVRRIGRAAAWTGEVRTLPEDGLPDDLRTHFNWRQHLIGDTSKIRRELGYRERVPADLAMARTVEWERAHPLEKYGDEKQG